VLQNKDITSFGQILCKQHSHKDYTNHNGFLNSTNLFTVSDNGEKTICSNNNTLYLENWQEDPDSSTRVTQLCHKMHERISFIRANFKKDFVVSGDRDGYLMIQRISTNGALLYNTQIVNDWEYFITSSTLDHYLCIGSWKSNIMTIDLQTFTLNSQLTLNYGIGEVNSLSMVQIGTEVHLIVSGTTYTRLTHPF
jgi:hypothetical protein